MASAIFHYKAILHSWREALGLFAPSSLSKILFLSLKSTIRVATSLIFYAVSCLAIILYFSRREKLALFGSYDLLLFTLMPLFLDYYSFVLLRPSVLPKNMTYFLKYNKKILYYWILNLLVYIFFYTFAVVVISLMVNAQRMPDNSVPVYAVFGGLIFLRAILQVFQDIATLFLLDNNLFYQCIILKRTFLFILYQLPFIIILYSLIIAFRMSSIIIIINLLRVWSDYSNPFLTGIIEAGILVFLILVSLFLHAFITLVYAKQVHEQPKLYL